MRKRIAVLGVLAALVWAAAPAEGGGSELDGAGWWWRAQTGLVEAPPPPSVPEDGLMVGNGPDGATAIAGVRYELEDEDATSATLTLEVADDQGGEAAAITACPAIARWRGAQAGTWEQRPTADCDGVAVAGVRDEDGESWTFDLGLLIDEGWVNVVLQPGAFEGAAPEEGAPEDAPDGGQSSEEEATPPFQVAFEPPADESLEAGAGFGDVDPDEFGADGTGASGEPSDAAEADGAPSGSPQNGVPLEMGADPGPAPDAEVADAPPPDVADANEPADRDEPVALVAPDANEQAEGNEQVAMEPLSFGQDRIRQLAALLGLSCAVAAVLLWRSPDGAGLAGLKPSLIVRPELAASSLPGVAGGDGAGPVGGLGRFAKPRNGEPPPL